MSAQFRNLAVVPAPPARLGSRHQPVLGHVTGPPARHALNRRTMTQEGCPRHIAFSAMSGVRAFSPELNAFGMTLPGFVDRGKVITQMPSLGLLTLAGITPTPFTVSYHEILPAELRQTGPDDLPACDLAAIGTFTAQVKDAYEVARRYRVRGTKTVIGGLHATALPEEALQHVDAVVVGEGELGWPRSRPSPTSPGAANEPVPSGNPPGASGAGGRSRREPRAMRPGRG